MLIRANADQYFFTARNVDENLFAFVSETSFGRRKIMGVEKGDIILYLGTKKVNYKWSIDTEYHIFMAPNNSLFVVKEPEMPSYSIMWEELLVKE